MSADGPATTLRPPPRRGPGAAGSAAYGAALTICLALSIAGLTLGALVALENSFSWIGAVLAAAEKSYAWAGALLRLAALPQSVSQIVLDYAFSGVAIVLALVLLVVRDRTWPVRLTALALVASAAAFNLQTEAAVHVFSGTSLAAVAPLFATGLPVVVCGSLLLAVAVLPATSAGARDGGASRTVLLAVGAGALLVIVAATIRLAMPYCCSLILGAVVPLAGATVLRAQMLRAPVVGLRTQSRQLFTIMVGTFAVAAVLALVTLVLWRDGWTGQNLVDPAVGADQAGDPIALQFWYSRLICTAIAVAVLVTTRRGGSYSAERLFSRGLIAAAVAVFVAGGYLVVHSLREDALHGDTPLGAAELVLLGGIPMALLLLPAYAATERLVDWLLYGSRPTPYTVLTRVAELGEAPDLARLAEALGQGLDASTCRLTVFCPGLRNTVYQWATGIDAPSEVEIPVRQGAEQVGTIAVDQGAVAMLQGRRSHLLDAVADSLGGVFQLHRRAIELNQDLRSEVAEERRIAADRRTLAAEISHDRQRAGRELHAGAHQHLHSARAALGVAENAVTGGQPDAARGLLTQVLDEIDAVDGLLTEAADRVAAPLLFTLGLVRALAHELTGRQPARLDAARFDESVPVPSRAAAAVYLCCLEAVGNARRRAPGAAVDVRLVTVPGHLHFIVHDAGPVRDILTARPAAGHWVQGLDARVTAVGGWVEVRPVPGTGTIVEGAVPLGLSGPGHAPVGPGAGPVPPLIDQVRDLAREACALYGDEPAAADVGRLADQLDAPVRICVSGPAGSGVTTLAEALRAARRQREGGSQARASYSEAPALAPLGGGARIVLLSCVGTAGFPPDDPLSRQPALTIGVLTRIDEIGAIEPTGAVMTVARQMAALAGSPDAGGRCSVVMPVAGQLARAAAALDDADLDVLRTMAHRSGPVPDNMTARRPTPRRREQPDDDPTVDLPSADVPIEVETRLRRRLGTSGVGLAIALVKTGQAPTATALAAALTRSSGMEALVEQLDRRLLSRALSTRARGAFLSLQELVAAQPPAREANRLRSLISAIRFHSHELVELDAVAELYSTRADLPADQRTAAARLLGAAGPDPHVRLALPDGAAQGDIAAAAARQETTWRELTSRNGWGDVGAVVVRVCERLRRPGSPT